MLSNEQITKLITQLDKQILEAYKDTDKMYKTFMKIYFIVTILNFSAFCLLFFINDCNLNLVMLCWGFLFVFTLYNLIDDNKKYCANKEKIKEFEKKLNEKTT